MHAWMHMRVPELSQVCPLIIAESSVITYVYRVRSTETEGRTGVNELGK